MYMVREFMNRFEQSIPLTDTMPTQKRQFLRFDLLMEEVNELLEACTVTEYLDATVDILYVTYGAALDAGFSPDTIDAAFREVHRSNMSKLWTEEELSHVPEGAKFNSVGGNRYIVRRSDGKIIKSPTYSPANLEQFIGKL